MIPPSKLNQNMRKGNIKKTLGDVELEDISCCALICYSTKKVVEAISDWFETL